MSVRAPRLFTNRLSCSGRPSVARSRYRARGPAGADVVQTRHGVPAPSRSSTRSSSRAPTGGAGASTSGGPARAGPVSVADEVPVAEVEQVGGAGAVGVGQPHPPRVEVLGAVERLGVAHRDPRAEPAPAE